jgi:hypothetical protein
VYSDPDTNVSVDSFIDDDRSSRTCGAHNENSIQEIWLLKVAVEPESVSPASKYYELPIDVRYQLEWFEALVE